MAGRGLGASELDKGVLDEYVVFERQRSGSRFPAAFQYLPLARRFLGAEGVLVLRGPATRDRGGLPRSSGGPLTGVIADLVVWLRAEGYARGTAGSVACTAARLGEWMTGAGLGVDDLDDAVLTRFVAQQSGGPRPHPSSARRIAAVRRFLVRTGLLSESRPTEVEATHVAMRVGQWGTCLRDERGQSPCWVREQQVWALGFLEQISGPDGRLHWDAVDARAVNQYATGRGRGYSLSSRRHLVSTMRSLLGWAFATGRIERQMAAAVLGPPVPALAGLPRGLTGGQVEAIKGRRRARHDTRAARPRDGSVDLPSRAAGRGGRRAAAGGHRLAPGADEGTRQGRARAGPADTG
jgi:site-specific recombinase XerC